MQYNFPKTPVELKSRKTGRLYFLTRADQVTLGQAAITQIALVCDEPKIYDLIFAEIFKGNRYSEENALFFTKLISEGWIKGNRFDWLILFEGSIVGTIGIKSLDGEIGYWQSSNHPGVMTLALTEVCREAKDAGFSHLWATVKKSNPTSIKVLEGAGFKRDSSISTNREDAYGYKATF